MQRFTRLRRRGTYAPRSNTARHDNHEKINSQVSLSFLSSMGMELCYQSPIDLLTDWLNGWLANGLNGLTGRLNWWLTDLLNDWLTYWMTDWLAGLKERNPKRIPTVRFVLPLTPFFHDRRWRVVTRCRVWIWKLFWSGMLEWQTRQEKENHGPSKELSWYRFHRLVWHEQNGFVWLRYRQNYTARISTSLF